MELSVLIEIGDGIGALPTIALCLLTAGIGLSLIRMQGLKVISDMQQASSSGTPLVEHLVHGFFLLVAGMLLFFPGFVTDTLGALLLIPPIRLMLGKAGLAHAAAKGTTGFYRSSHQEAETKSTIIVDGEFWEAEPQTSKVIDQSPKDPEPANSNTRSNKTED
ncbi:FxsA family protein [Kordiimonas aquimaris]|uniref:FxsA family protein n=1 Tax=Kordiimonas aquimaris TaxID=707591 RepID=UPI00374CFB12